MKTIEKLQNLLPGQNMVYYTSHDAPISNSAFDEKEVRNHAYSGYMSGIYELTQRLVRSTGAHGVFEYICTRRREPPIPEVMARRRYYLRCITEKGSNVKGERTYIVSRRVGK